MNQRGYHVDRHRDVISTYINIESTSSVCWEVLIDTNNTQYKNIYQSETKEINIDQSVEQLAFTDDLILQPEFVTETTPAIIRPTLKERKSL